MLELFSLNNTKKNNNNISYSLFHCFCIHLIIAIIIIFLIIMLEFIWMNDEQILLVLKIKY
jgi:hypothetical protein